MIRLATPIGPLWCGVDPQERPRCGWAELEPPREAFADPPERWNLPSRLAAWFADPDARRRDRFLDLPLPGGSPFADACRRALRAVRPGERIAYGELARRIGRPASARAVGRAMRTNPAPILVPCHRVVAACGGLGGYAGTASPGRGSAKDEELDGRSRTHPALRIKSALLALERDAAEASCCESPVDPATCLQSAGRICR